VARAAHGVTLQGPAVKARRRRPTTFGAGGEPRIRAVLRLRRLLRIAMVCDRGGAPATASLPANSSPRPAEARAALDPAHRPLRTSCPSWEAIPMGSADASARSCACRNASLAMWAAPRRHFVELFPARAHTG
jgi:hypothetical protein